MNSPLVIPVIIALHVAVVLVVVVGVVREVLQAEGDNGRDVARHLIPALAHHGFAGLR